MLPLFISVWFYGCRPSPPNQSSLGHWQVNLDNHGVSTVLPIHRRYSVGSEFGYRVHPVTGKHTMHNGHDVPCRSGAWIRSVASGEVTISERSHTAGNYIEVVHRTHPKRISTRYLHLKRRHVRVGESIAKGEVIGSCGSTGRSTGPHLHFEVRVNDTPIPPLVLRPIFSDGMWNLLNTF